MPEFRREDYDTMGNRRRRHTPAQVIRKIDEDIGRARPASHPTRSSASSSRSTPMLSSYRHCMNSPRAARYLVGAGLMSLGWRG